jgi:hypothetical protein
MTAMTVLAAAWLAIAQPGLTVSNPRLTYGPLGPDRPSKTYLPGDVVVLVFEIQGLQHDAAGRGQYAMSLEVTDAKGAVIYKQQPKSTPALNYLGGAKHQAVGVLQLSMTQAAGAYTIKLGITDDKSKQSAAAQVGIEVSRPDFGIGQVLVSSDPDGNFPVPHVGIPGQTVFVNFSALGFGRDKTKNPNVAVSMNVFDESGKPTLAKPLTGQAGKDIPEKITAIPMQFGLSLNRVGTFKVELTAKDAVSGKTATVSFPFKVVNP